MTSESSSSPRITPPPARRRGGQPGNHNARAHGLYSRISPSSSFPSELEALQRGLRSSMLPLQLGLLSVIAQRDRLDEKLDQTTGERETIALLDLRFKISSVHTRLLRELAIIARPRMALMQQARDPLRFIRSSFHHRGISRDADSFASPCRCKEGAASRTLCAHSDMSLICRREPVAADISLDSAHSVSGFCSLSTQAGVATPSSEPTSLALEHLAFTLTDEQWAILAPLIPPDPADDHLHGDPPALIAANRWGFTDTVPNRRTSSEALRQYRRLTPRHLYNEEPIRKRQRPGRPTFSPRPVLDAIFYKLSTGCSWSELPSGSPSWRTCQVYYRRLFNSGRLYTLLLALYHDLRQRSGVTPLSLVESHQLTLDDRGKVIAAGPNSTDWRIQTSLLFLQLAHTAHVRGHHLPAAVPGRMRPVPINRPRPHSFFSTRKESTVNSPRHPTRTAANQPEASDLIPWSPSLGPPSKV